MSPKGRQADSIQDPFQLFKEWFEEAQERKEAKIPSPEAMTVATCTRRGIPSARIVLLKDVSRGGFVFYTNYESRKSEELISNPRAALVFYWEPLQKQVRVEGKVTRVSKAESDAYFATRPRGSQIGAWASEQSRVIASREELVTRTEELERKFEGREVPRPPHWGGFRVIPERIEFWTGREYRLHDRILYVRKGRSWKVSRLSP